MGVASPIRARTRVRSHMLRAQHNTYVYTCMCTAGGNYEWSVREMAEARPLLVKQVVPAAARRTSVLL